MKLVQVRCRIPALELAERGYVTLAPDYPNFGDNRFDPYAHGYASATMKGIVNHRRAVDLLQSLPEVDPGRIGVIGHSLGGHNSHFLAVFDPRIKAVVTSCGCVSEIQRRRSHGLESQGIHATHRRDLRQGPCPMPFEFTELLACLAPRPVFISAPVEDDNFAVAGVRDCVTAGLPVYQKIYNAGLELQAFYPAGGHDFPEEARAAAYEFLARSLR